MPEWTAEVVAQMHRYDISGKELAEKAGMSTTWLSLQLRGRKKSERARLRIVNALLALVMQRQADQAR